MNDQAKLLNVDRVRHGLKVVLWIHIVMFFIVFVSAMHANSISVYLDSIDFFGDSIGYALSLYFLERQTKLRSYISICKAVVIVICAIPILSFAIHHYMQGHMPQYEIMTFTGFAGVIAHIICLYYLNALRKGDSNLVSSWVLTINDLLCNILIIVTSFTIYYTGQAFWDLIAAVIILSIAVFGALKILKRAVKEIKSTI